MINSLLIAQALRDSRQHKGVTLREVAEASGVSIATLSRLEKGETNPDLGTAEAVAVWLERPVTDFVTGASDVGDAPSASVIDSITSCILQDGDLSDSKKIALSKAVRLMYQVARNGDE